MAMGKAAAGRISPPKDGSGTAPYLAMPGPAVDTSPGMGAPVYGLLMDLTGRLRSLESRSSAVRHRLTGNCNPATDPCKDGGELPTVDELLRECLRRSAAVSDDLYDLERSLALDDPQATCG